MIGPRCWMVCGFCLSVLLSSGCSGRTPPVPIYLGQLAPRSGPMRAYGHRTEQAILLAVEEARAAEGQVLGRPVAFLHPDCPDDADAAQAVAVRLLALNNAVGLIGSPDPKAAERLCRVAQQEKTPLLLPVWLPETQRGAFGVSLAAEPADQGRALAQFVKQVLRADRVALAIDSRGPGAQPLSAAFVQTLGKAAIAYQGEFAADDKLGELARQVTAVAPAVVVLAGNGASLEKLKGELQQAGLKDHVPLVFGGHADASLETLAGQSPLYWTTLFPPPDAGRPKHQLQFATLYQDRFGQPADEATALAHDAARVLMEGIRQAKETTGEKVRVEIDKLKDFEGLCGPITIDNGQAVGRPVYVVHRQDNQVKVAWPALSNGAK